MEDALSDHQTDFPATAETQESSSIHSIIYNDPIMPSDDVNSLLLDAQDYIQSPQISVSQYLSINNPLQNTTDVDTSVVEDLQNYVVTKDMLKTTGTSSDSMQDLLLIAKDAASTEGVQDVLFLSDILAFNRQETAEEVKSKNSGDTLPNEEIPSEIKEEIQSEIKEEIQSESKAEITKEIQSQSTEEIQSESKEEIQLESKAEITKEIQPKVVSEVPENIQETAEKTQEIASKTNEKPLEIPQKALNESGKNSFSSLLSSVSIPVLMLNTLDDFVIDEPPADYSDFKIQEWQSFPIPAKKKGPKGSNRRGSLRYPTPKYTQSANDLESSAISEEEDFDKLDESAVHDVIDENEQVLEEESSLLEEQEQQDQVMEDPQGESEEGLEIITERSERDSVFSQHPRVSVSKSESSDPSEISDVIEVQTEETSELIDLSKEKVEEDVLSPAQEPEDIPVTESIQKKNSITGSTRGNLAKLISSRRVSVSKSNTSLGNAQPLLDSVDPRFEEIEEDQESRDGVIVDADTIQNSHAHSVPNILDLEKSEHIFENPQNQSQMYEQIIRNTDNIDIVYINRKLPDDVYQDTQSSKVPVLVTHEPFEMVEKSEFIVSTNDFVVNRQNTRIVSQLARPSSIPLPTLNFKKLEPVAIDIAEQCAVTGENVNEDIENLVLNSQQSTFKRAVTAPLSPSDMENTLRAIKSSKSARFQKKSSTTKARLSLLLTDFNKRTSEPGQRQTVLTNAGLSLEISQDKFENITLANILRDSEFSSLVHSVMTKKQPLPGPSLPALESRPLTGHYRTMYSPKKTAQTETGLSSYSQPLPITRYPNVAPLKKVWSHERAVNSLRASREARIQEAYLGNTSTPPKWFFKQRSMTKLFSQGLLPTFDTQKPSHQIYETLGKVHWKDMLTEKKQKSHFAGNFDVRDYSTRNKLRSFGGGFLYNREEFQKAQKEGVRLKPSYINGRVVREQFIIKAVNKEN